MKIVKIVLAILLTAALGIGILNFNDNPEDEYEVEQKYTALSQGISRNTSLSSVRDRMDESASGLQAGVISVAVGSAKSVQDWIDYAKKAHNAFRAEGFDYLYGGYTHMKDGTYVRRDCSGYVSYALYLAGFTDNSIYGSSSMDLTPLGFTNMGSGSNVQIKAGDVLSYSNHIHIAVSDGGSEVFNWGSHSSAAAPYGSAAGNDCFKIDPRVNNNRANSTVVRVWRLTKGSTK